MFVLRARRKRETGWQDEEEAKKRLQHEISKCEVHEDTNLKRKR